MYPIREIAEEIIKKIKSVIRQMKSRSYTLFSVGAGLSDARGTLIKIMVNALTSRIAIAPIFFSTRNDITNVNAATTHRLRMMNNPTPMPSIKVVISFEGGKNNIELRQRKRRGAYKIQFDR